MPTIGTRGAISARGFGWSGGVSPRGAPSSLNASLGSPSNSVISLTWTNGDVLAQTQVFRDDVKITTINAGTSTYSDTGLAENTTFTYKVRHTRNNLVSADSGTSSATTYLPFRLSYTGTSTAVWQPGDGAGADLGFATGSWSFTVNKTRSVTIRGCGPGYAGQYTNFGAGGQGYGGGGGAFHLGFSYTLQPGVTYYASSGGASSETQSAFSSSVAGTILALGGAAASTPGEPIVGGGSQGGWGSPSGAVTTAGTGGGGRGGAGNYGGSSDAEFGRGEYGGNGQTAGGAGVAGPNGYDGGSGGFGGSFAHAGTLYGHGGGGAGGSGQPEGGSDTYDRTVYLYTVGGGVIGIRT